MRLLDNWQEILTKAWSVKFNIASAIFGGLEVGVQLIQPAGIPNGLFAGMAALISIMATGARVLAQGEKT